MCLPNLNIVFEIVGLAKYLDENFSNQNIYIFKAADSCANGSPLSNSLRQCFYKKKFDQFQNPKLCVSTCD